MTGNLSLEEVYAIFEHLPVEISFVDVNDKVKYFNKEGKRIFVRAGSIGNKVENCHPQRSLDMVLTIVKSFKSGESDHAKFWFKVNDKFVLVQYFAIRNDEGNYIGTLEVSQDITFMQKLRGEKRTLKGINFDK